MLLQVNHLTFGYDTAIDFIFDNVSFHIDTDWKTGLIARNGFGKTTFLQLLTGTYPYQGTILSPIQMMYFPFLIRDPNVTIESLFYEHTENSELWRLQIELSLLQMQIDDFKRPFYQLSKGEQTKVLLGILFCKENTYLLIDEPTNHLDAHGRKVLADYLQSKSGFLLVSHDRQFLDSCIDHVLAFERNNIRVEKGNVTSYFENRTKREQEERKRNDQLKKSIDQLQEAKKRSAKWANQKEASKNSGTNNKSGLRPDKGFIGAKAAKLMKRAKSFENRMEQNIEEKRLLFKNVDRFSTISLEATCNIEGTLFSFREVQFLLQNNLFHRPITFFVNAGEKVAILGNNGCGKTTLLRYLTGEEISYLGTIEQKKLCISYVPQEINYLNGSLKRFCEERSIQYTNVLTLLYKLGVDRNVFDTMMQNLSEGERKKFALAISLSQQADVYIWDEPLNYLDIFAREQIIQLVKTSPASFLFVEHDQYFCEQVATQKLFFERL